MATRICTYDNMDANSIACAAIFQHRYNDTTNTLKLLSNLSHANIDTYIGTLSATSIDAIYFTNGICGGAVSEVFDSEQIDDLLAKLTVAGAGAIVGSGYTDASTHTTNTIGKTGAAWTVNGLIGKWVKITGGTGIGQTAYIVSNTAEVLTIEGVFTVEPDATSDFEVWTIPGLKFIPNGTDKFRPAYMWESVYSEMSTIPQILFWLGSDLYGEIYAQADSFGAATLTDTGAFTGLNMDGKFVAVVSGSTGYYQKGEVLSHTDNQLTLTENWKYQPTGTCMYRTFSEDKEVLYDCYAKLYIVQKMWDLTDSATVNKWKSVLGARGSDENIKFPDLNPVVDQDVLDEIVEEGKIMAEYVLESVSRS